MINTVLTERRGRRKPRKLLIYETMVALTALPHRHRAGHLRDIARADTFAATVAPVIAEAQAAWAKSLRQIAAALNGRGIATARGGRWEASTVANILKRAAA